MGGSQSREDLAKAKADLDVAQRAARALTDERDDLKQRVASQAEELKKSRSSLEEASRSAAEQVAKKSEEVGAAVKKQQLAEELRRSDALLAKRLLDAQLRLYGGVKNLPLPSGLANGAMPEELTMAANMALAAQDELQLRQMLLHTANELEATQKHAAGMEKAVLQQKRGELARELWLQELYDVSMTVRSSSLSVSGGVRMPRKMRPGEAGSGLRGVPGSGLSPGFAVLKHFGDDLTARHGKWAAVGGSVLLDAQKKEMAAMRFALLAQPMADQQWGFSMDHTGSLSGTLKFKPVATGAGEGLAARIFGTMKLKGRKEVRGGVELVYDLPD